MKFMPAIAAEALGPRPALESETLSMEGWLREDWKERLKNPIATLKEGWKEDKLRQNVDMKLRVLENQRKVLEKTKSEVSSARDNGMHEIKLKRVTHCNFSAKTAKDYVDGMQKNRKFLSSMMVRMKGAKSKSEAKSINDQVEAEFNKKGQIADKVMATRAEVLKVIDEALAMNMLTRQYCEVAMEMADKEMVLPGYESKKDTVSNEGIGDVFKTIFAVFAIFVVAIVGFVVGYLITINLITLAFTAPFIGVPLMVLWFSFLVWANTGHEQEEAEHLYAEAHKR